jgi:cytochrome c oxidase cbb3-type subunit 1
MLHFAVFALIDHGDSSNHDPVQIAALTSLAIWPPLVAYRLRAFSWSAVARRWLAALAVWSALLVATGVLGFLPGVLERWKFTNALVAHAHIAMAGLVSCWMVVILDSLIRGSSSPESRLREVFASRRGFWAWQLGCGLYVAAMLVLGTLEGFDPGLVIRAEALSQAFYALRWGAGGLMFWASLGWLRAAWSHLQRSTADASLCPGSRSPRLGPPRSASVPDYEEAA